MSTVQICGFAVTAVFFAVVLRRFRPEYATVVTVAASLTVLTCAVRCVYPAVLYLQTQAEQTEISGSYLKLMLRALGIGLLTECCADLCRDCNEASLASKIELLGRAEILVLCLPLMQELLQKAISLLAYASSQSSVY